MPPPPPPKRLKPSHPPHTPTSAQSAHIHTAYLRSYSLPYNNPTPLPPLPTFMSQRGVPKHEYNVQPAGNLMFDDEERRNFNKMRTSGMGTLSKLMDSHLHDVLSYLPSTSCFSFSSCSWITMVLTRSDIRVWKDLVFKDLYVKGNGKGGGVKWRDSYWRTYAETKGAVYKGERDWIMEGRERRKVYSDVLYRSYLCYHCLPPPLPSTSPIPRISSSTLTYDSFVSREIKNEPFVIVDLDMDAEGEFKGMGEWRREGGLEGMAKGKKFRCTSVQSSHAVSTTIGDYTNYAKHVKEESPMYLFERDMGNLVEGYGEGMTNKLPFFTSQSRSLSSGSTHRGDLFHLLGSDRPDYRWLIVGPSFSGSAFHIDPNCTHAWNMPVVGRKLWIFYPPGKEPPGVRVRDGGDEVVMPISLGEWVLSFWDEHKRRMAEGGKDGPMECIVSPGECLFVPHGWWHCVINLPPLDSSQDLGITIAITQNYVSSSNLSDCLRFLEMNKSQISGLGDRAGGEKAKGTLGVRLEERLKSIMSGEEWNQVEREKKKGFGCRAWKNDTTSVMAAAKEETGGGFSFDFGM